VPSHNIPSNRFPVFVSGEITKNPRIEKIVFSTLKTQEIATHWQRVVEDAGGRCQWKIKEIIIGIR
jgi:hypothetical protein